MMRTKPWSRVLWVGMAVIMTVGALASTGCERALFDEKQTRTPYERYSALRGQRVEMSQKNEYGGDTPALRERLKPLDTP